MRINSLRVDRYGPLSRVEQHRVADFTLVHGPNEEGKTLLLDATIRLMFRGTLGRRLKDFGNMGRVEQDPVGHVVVALDGEEIVLGTQKSFDKILPIDATDFRNVFVVRDSDLSIPRERDYFTGVSERLTGLRTTEIARIRQAVRTKGRLTAPRSDAELADNVETGHIKRKVLAAGRCVERIDEVRAELEASDFERLEHVLIDTRDRIERNRAELASLQKARQRERDVELEARLQDLEANHEALARSAKVTDEGLDRWRQAERDRRRLQADIDDARRRSNQQRERVEETDRTLRELSDRMGDLESALSGFDAEVAPRLERFEALHRTVVVRGAQRRLWTRLAAGSGGLTALALIGAIATHATGAIMLALCAATVALVSTVWLVLGHRVRGASDGALRDMRVAASAHGVGGDSAEALRGFRADLARGLQQTSREIERARIDRESGQLQMDALEDRMRALRKEHSETDEAVSTERALSGVADLDAYHRALLERNETVQRIRVSEAALGEALGAADGESPLAQWKRTVTARLGDGARDLPPADPGRESQLEAELDRLDASAKKTAQALEAGRDRLRALEQAIRDAGAIDGREVLCRTTAELDRLRTRLTDFVSAVTERKQDASVALRILEQVEEEERAKVLSLFGPKQPVSHHFHRMTRGRYVAVRLDVESGELRVAERDGGSLPATSLSGGTLDQLYLSIRLSLAQGMLGGRSGFLLLDDPFVKSDAERLGEQLDLLRDLVAQGWQVIYFSAKREILDALAEDIEGGRVRLVRLSATSDAPQDERRGGAQHQVGDLFS